MTARPSRVFLRDATRTALRMEQPNAGPRFLDAVDETVKQLLAQPELGRFRPEVKPGLRSWPVAGFGNWIVFYRVDKESIRLVRLLHGARDLPHALRRDWMNPLRFDLNRVGTPAELAQTVAERWLSLCATSPRGTKLVALSGGRIAKDFFTAVARLSQERGQSLAHVHFFWADERCVVPEHAESNYRSAAELLLVPLGLAPQNLHRIRGEEEPGKAARQAEAELRRFAPSNAAGQPLLDLVLLGMGEDGHVASLFPGEPEDVMSSHAVYRAVTASKPPPRRITLGYAAIAAAREVWVLASGAGKEAALRESLSPAGNTPLARVLRERERTRIFTDLAP